MENYSVPDSAPVSVVIIGVESLDSSLSFYADTLGLETLESSNWQGPEFERHWNLPAGSSAKCVFLGHGADPIGRILLMEFDAANRKRIRPQELKRATGLFNLNVYSSDIYADVEILKAQGFNFWSDPVHHDFGPTMGETKEVIFDGPDGIVINMIQLLTVDADTYIGKLVAFIGKYGRTRTGFTSVVTTACGVLDMEKALEFYYGPLKMTCFMDTTLQGAKTNNAIGLPEDAETRSVFIQGEHEYGKIALSSPLNYEIPNLVAASRAPNIGYLAQSFEVNDLNRVANECIEIDVRIISGPEEVNLPGRGLCRVMMTLNPGSGALQEIFQQLGDS
jgi:catechol 2,3-dioxygenase-like lactoylglutathione lyase family enzyme